MTRTAYVRAVDRLARAEAEAERCAKRAAYWMRRFLEAREASARTRKRLEVAERDAATDAPVYGPGEGDPESESEAGV